MGTAPDIARRDDAGRLDATGWGLLFLVSGILALIPGLPGGAWLVALGLLMLGLAATRLVVGLPLDPLGMVVGFGALAAGLGSMAGFDVQLPVFALLLIACGLTSIAGQLRLGRADR